MDKKRKVHILDEYTVNIREVVFRLAEQWKCMLICAIIIALALNMAMYIRRAKAATASVDNFNAVAARTDEEILSTLSEDDRDLVKSVYDMSLAMKEIEEFVQESPVMKVDVYQAREIQLTWLIEADAENRRDIVDAYDAKLRSKAVSERIAASTNKGTDLDASRVQSLIYTKGINNNNSRGILTVVMAIDGQTDESEMQEAIINAVNGIHSDLNNAEMSHTLKLVSADTVTVFDSYYANVQEEAYRRVHDYNARITNLRNNFTSAQNTAYSGLLERDQAQANLNKDDAPDDIKVPMFDKMILLLGFLFGAIIYSMCYLLYVFIGKHIQDTEALKKESGISTLGEWHSKSRYSGVLQDRYFYNIHHRRNLDRTESLSNIEETLVNICKHNNIGNVVFALCSNFTDMQSSFIKDVSEEIAEKGISNSCLQSIRREQKSMSDKEILKSEGVILVIDGDKTVLGDLDMVHEKSSMYNVPIVGSILLT